MRGRPTNLCVENSKSPDFAAYQLMRGRLLKIRGLFHRFTLCEPIRGVPQLHTKTPDTFRPEMRSNRVFARSPDALVSGS